MAKFFGKIGFVETVEISPGIWKELYSEREYYGDIIRQSRYINNNQESTNKDIGLNNDISIVADSYANENIYAMRYVEFAGSKWTITNAEINYPRIRLTIGGIYNAESDQST